MGWGRMFFHPTYSRQTAQSRQTIPWSCLFHTKFVTKNLHTWLHQVQAELVKYAGAGAQQLHKSYCWEPQQLPDLGLPSVGCASVGAERFLAPELLFTPSLSSASALSAPLPTLIDEAVQVGVSLNICGWAFKLLLGAPLSTLIDEAVQVGVSLNMY